jgi:hypothetical protein
MLDTTAAWTLLLSGDRSAAVAACTAALDDSGASATDLAGWAELAEAAGASLLGLAGWRRVRSLAPDHPNALERIRVLEDERGSATTPDDTTDELASESPAPPTPDAADLARFVSLFGGRAGVHARMWRSDPTKVGYSPVKTGLTPDLVSAHLRGDLTLGAYLVRHGDLVTQAVFDLDVRKASLDAAWGDPAATRDLRRRVHSAGLALRERLQEAGLRPLLVDSGFKGRHLWCFFPEELPASRVRAVGRALVTALGPRDPALHIDLFPAQDHVGPGGLGSLVKLPLGIHLRTDRRCSLLDADGRPCRTPWDALRSVERIPLEAVRLARAPQPSRPEPVEEQSDVEAPPSTDRPPFTAADLETRPRLAAVLGGCPVLSEVARLAMEEGDMDREARAVAEYTVGHLEDGPAAVNYLLERAGVTEGRMGRPHNGSPMSCRRIRQRLPGIAGRVPCACRFSDVPEYDHPIHHARGVSDTTGVEDDRRPTEQLLDALSKTRANLQQLGREEAALRRVAVTRLSGLPGRSLDRNGGRWRLVDEEGMPGLVYEAARPEPG